MTSARNSVLARLPERLAEPIRQDVWDPSAVMRDLALPSAYRDPLAPALARHGLTLCDVTVKHPFSKVEHRLTVVDGAAPALFLLHVDFRVVDTATQDNVDALERLTKLIAPGARVRIFTGSDAQPALAFERQLESWRLAELDAQFVQQRHFREVEADDDDALWQVLRVARPVGAPALVPEPVRPAGGARIFVSYAHADDDIFDRLRVHLSGLTHSIDDLDVWTDDRIDAGDVWRDEIDRALDAATCAVLLVSADFLSSRFVNDHELPVLLEAAHGAQLQVFWLKARGVLVPDKITRYQALHDPKRPLAALGPEELETALAAAMEALSAKLGP